MYYCCLDSKTRCQGTQLALARFLENRPNGPAANGRRVPALIRFCFLRPYARSVLRPRRLLSRELKAQPTHSHVHEKQAHQPAGRRWLTLRVPDYDLAYIRPRSLSAHAPLFTWSSVPSASVTLAITSYATSTIVEPTAQASTVFRALRLPFASVAGSSSNYPFCSPSLAGPVCRAEDIHQQPLSLRVLTPPLTIMRQSSTTTPHHPYDRAGVL